MKTNSWFFLLLILSGSFISAEMPVSKDPQKVVAQELEHLAILIEMTEKNLQIQKDLKNKILAYQNFQRRYLETKDKTLRYDLVMSAFEILNIIKDHHLTHLFSSDFLGELSLFANFANKGGIPKLE